ncbi:MAG: hypothetical protein GY788_23410 [bacterium]|nr:hypothetical protein [bacterium]
MRLEAALAEIAGDPSNKQKKDALENSGVRELGAYINAGLDADDETIDVLWKIRSRLAELAPEITGELKYNPRSGAAKATLHRYQELWEQTVIEGRSFSVLERDGWPDKGRLSRTYRKDVVPQVAGFLRRLVESEGLEAAKAPREPDLLLFSPDVGPLEIDQLERLRPIGIELLGSGIERVVDVVQRLTLNRWVEIAISEVPVHSSQLGAAEQLLAPSLDHQWSRRRWCAMPKSASQDQVLSATASAVDLGGNDLPSLVIDVRGPLGALGVDGVRDLHVAAAAELGVKPGPTVLIGVSASDATPRPGQVRFVVAGDRVMPLEVAELNGALVDGCFEEIVRNGDHTTCSVLAVMARTGVAEQSSIGELRDQLLSKAPPSMARAWQFATASHREPQTWIGATRDFTALVFRALGGPGVPFAALPSEVLHEQFLWDEVVRLRPSQHQYSELLGLDRVFRQRIGLLGGSEAPAREGCQ